MNYRNYKSLLCWLFGHKKVFVQEPRIRYKYKKTPYGIPIASKPHYVNGGYCECYRCGKKLSNWERWHFEKVLR